MYSHLFFHTPSSPSWWGWWPISHVRLWGLILLTILERVYHKSIYCTGLSVSCGLIYRHASPSFRPQFSAPVFEGHKPKSPWFFQRRSTRFHYPMSIKPLDYHTGRISNYKSIPRHLLLPFSPSLHQTPAFPPHQTPPTESSRTPARHLYILHRSSKNTSHRPTRA